MRNGKIYASMGALATAAMMFTTPAAALPVSGQGTWEVTLQARDLNGDTVTDAFYDTSLNVTWLGAVAPGMLNWTDANTWANSLTFGGYSDWRLPTVTDTGAPGCTFSYAGGTDCGYNSDTAASELAHLFYVTLGNLSLCPPGDATCASGPQPGYGLTNTGDFPDLRSGGYWTDTEYAPVPGLSWMFRTNLGHQDVDNQVNRFYAIAVRPGDVVNAVPEPESMALVLMAFATAGVVRRRRPS